MQSFRQFTILLSPLVFRLTYSYIATVVSLKLLDYSGIANYHFKPNWGILNAVMLFLALLTLFMLLELKREKISAALIRVAYIALLSLAVLAKITGIFAPVDVPVYLYQVSVVAAVLGLYLFYWYDLSILKAEIAPKSVKSQKFSIGCYWHWFALAAIVLLGAILRVWNLDYLQGTDNFNLLAARAYTENGVYFYQGNHQITRLVAWLFSIFGQSWQVARIPMVIFGVASVWLVFYLGGYINKYVGLISAFLLAISPVAIEKSSFIREYSEAMFWGLAASLIMLKIFTRYKHEPDKFIKYFPLSLILVSGFLYFYSSIANSTAIRANLALVFFISVPIVCEFIKINFPLSLKYFIAILLPCLYFLQAYIYLPINIFIKGYRFQPYWVQMFFDPQVATPMQWFSHAVVPEAFLIILFILPAFILYWKRELLILYFVFAANLLLFVFKYNPDNYNHSRYLYYLLPFFVVIFASGLYLLFAAVARYKQRILVSALSISFVLLYFTTPSNTIHAAKHDLSIWENKDDRQPTASGSRDSYLNLISFLREQGLTNKDAVAIQGDDQFYITWYFNYPVTQKYSIKYPNGVSQDYDCGDKIYIIDPYRNVDELDNALAQNRSGYLIGHSSSYKEESFNYREYSFKYLGTAENYKVYKWVQQEGLVDSADDSSARESLETLKK